MRKRILQEIRRIASENGGRTPGKIQFAKETGIGESEWYGKIWVRWNDAITEAGLTPNEKQSQLNSGRVLQKYAEVCRHYGRPPTNAELRLYARLNIGFPSHNTFTKHFGRKNDLLCAMREWAIEQADYELVSILPETIASEADTDSGTNSQTKLGYVYLLKSGSFYKVGRSDDIERRIKQISISLPEKADLVHVIRTDDPVGIEAYWHQRFAEKRANGEWFGLSTDDIKAFKKRKFQ